MIFSLRQLQEKCREHRKLLYTAFINLTKAFDLVSRRGPYSSLRRKAALLSYWAWSVPSMRTCTAQSASEDNVRSLSSDQRGEAGLRPRSDSLESSTSRY
eukprot:TRINITY_DN15304_c0_g1_i1.p4 TRINITY_DN15304_c0_g1~~TRINITY_DN15304_c0_g1_i1.p4  ORF type:complete len:100 (-),score=12.19 TRINITY_DN15304_c0_g1_i1:725-1024(-)